MNRTIAVSLVWQTAAAEAAALKHTSLDLEHLFIGLCSLDKLVRYHEERREITPGELIALRHEYQAMQDVFYAHALAPQDLRRRTRQRLRPGPYVQGEAVIRRSRPCRKVFEQAERLALPHPTTTLHLLAALLDGPGRTVEAVLREQRAEPRVLRKKLTAQLLAGAALLARQPPLVPEPAPSPETTAMPDAAPPRPPPGPPADLPGSQPVGQPGGPSAASEAAPSSNYLERFGKDLVEEARGGRLAPVTGRRDVLLLLLQTLARSKKSNPMLVGEPGVGKTAVVEALAHRIARGRDPVLDGSRLVQLDTGSLLGGTTLRGELEERVVGLLRELEGRPDVILFVDEIHALLGNREVADLFKPALARGQIRCIGATTVAEYRRYIEKDPALERRFEKVIVPEPSRDEALDILATLRTRFAERHGVEIDDEALAAAVDLSIRFDQDHHLPDKAIDLLDKAVARTLVPMLSMAVAPGAGGVPAPPEPGRVTAATIVAVLSDKVGVPAEVLSGQLEAAGGARLLHMEAFLKERVRGQDEAVSRLCRRLQLAQAGLAGRRGPLGVFLFLGPSGVGKTELARSLTAFLFGDPGRMIRLDMSEYQEAHTVSKLIGSPPGYVGSDEEGQLTGRLRTTPYTVVLLDEVEKGHPRVFDLFLQVFDEGRLTDNKGRTVDARNAVFIMTSNLRVDEPEDGAAERDAASLTRWFRPELLGRVDEIIRFRALGEAEIRLIVQDLLKEVRDSLRARHGVELDVTPDAERLLARKGHDPAYGARELRRAVEQHLHVPLTQLILEDRLRQHPKWRARAGDDHLVLEPAS